MSKLSRKEFKELLTEWNQNFISERYQSQTTKDAFQNIHSLNTSGEEFPELNIDVIEYDHDLDGEISEKLINLLMTKMGNYDNGIGFKFNKNDDYKFIKKALDILYNEGKLKDKSYESILNNSNGLIISPKGSDNEFESNNFKGISSTYENSNWMLHDVFHSLLENQGWNSSDGLVGENDLVQDFHYNYTEFDNNLHTGNLITDYFNHCLTHHNINDNIKRSVGFDDYLFDMPIFITYFGLHVENGQINIEKSRKKLKSKLESDFKNHHVLSRNSENIFEYSERTPKERKDFFIKYFLEFQDFVINILNEYNNKPVVYFKADIE